MCDFSEIEASAFSDTMTWDPMNSDSAVQEIESRMKDLKTEEKKESPPKEAEEPPEETAENEAPKEEEEPGFGEAEKIVPTETEENNDPQKDSSHGDAIVPLKPRVNILQPTQEGQASDSEQARPATKRSRSIPPTARAKSLSRPRSHSRGAVSNKGCSTISRPLSPDNRERTTTHVVVRRIWIEEKSVHCRHDDEVKGFCPQGPQEHGIRRTCSCQSSHCRLLLRTYCVLSPDASKAACSMRNAQR